MVRPIIFIFKRTLPLAKIKQRPTFQAKIQQRPTTFISDLTREADKNFFDRNNLLSQSLEFSVKESLPRDFNFIRKDLQHKRIVGKTYCIATTIASSKIRTHDFQEYNIIIVNLYFASIVVNAII